MRAAWVALACSACHLHFDALGDATRPQGDACTTMPIPGLVAYFPMEQGDINGNVLLDRSGGSHNGVISGTPAVTLSPGMIGNALDFSATTNSWVDISGLPVPTTTGTAVTVSAWFKRPTTAMAPNDVMFDFPPPDLGARYDLWLVNSSLCFNTEHSDCWGAAGSFLDRWIHVAAIFHNDVETTSELYLDGVAQTSGCLMPTACTFTDNVANPLRLGARDFYQYYGLLDEVRIYDHGLSAAEVANLAAGAACE
jgi:hypothetical protein